MDDHVKNTGHGKTHFEGASVISAKNMVCAEEVDDMVYRQHTIISS